MKPTTPSSEPTPESDVRCSEFRLFRVSEAAKVLGVKERTLRNWILNGAFPCRRINGQMYLSPEDLRAGIDAAAVRHNRENLWSSKESDDESSAA